MKNFEKTLGTGDLKTEDKKRPEEPRHYDASAMPREGATSSLRAKQMLLNDLAFIEVAENERGINVLKIHPTSNSNETIYYTANGIEIDELEALVKNKKLGDAVSKKQ